jgi:hypothetical protein
MKRVVLLVCCLLVFNASATLGMLRALNPDQRSLVRSLLMEFAQRERSAFVVGKATAAVQFIDDNF